MNQTEQMREAWDFALELAAQTIELYDDATMRHDYMLDSSECAGIIRALKLMQPQALAAEPAPLVRLTQIERDRIAMSCQSTQQVISATIDAMIAKNGGL